MSYIIVTTLLKKIIKTYNIVIFKLQAKPDWENRRSWIPCSIRALNPHRALTHSLPSS